MLLSCFLFAQNKKGVKNIYLAQTINKTVPGSGSSTITYNLQVGLPILGQVQIPLSRTNRPLDVRFPMDILYLYNTFSEEYFDISKGYYGDKIKIDWEVKNNLTGSSAVTGIKIYRRIYNPNLPSAWGTPIANLAANVTFFEDKYVDGGVLYEYKVHAIGVNAQEIKYSNYITGIGFRSPTAIVTGNINFKGGNPVKDVVIQANSKNGVAGKRVALKVSQVGEIAIHNLTKGIQKAGTLQAWLKPAVPYTDDNGYAIRLFNIHSTSDLDNAIEVKVKLKAVSKVLEVNIGNSIYELKNYYPTGNTNSRGDDELTPVTNFNTNFVHFSVILSDGNVPTLYINGRPISDKYVKSVDSVLKSTNNLNYTAPYFSATIPTQSTSLLLSATSAKWDNVFVGGGADAIVDEIRIWNSVVDTATIRTDYKRYISGNHTNLVTYVNANEGAGFFAYDLSRTGFDYNKNNASLDTHTTWVYGEGNTPTNEQLGILGVTDTKGNYEITNIPYTGTGESYTITPMFGQHKFEANQQLVFLGQGSEVANKIDFVDVSSFSFKGIVMYDSRGVFPSFVDAERNGELRTSDDGINYVSGGAAILDEGYNYYQINDKKYSKGAFWKNNNGTTNDASDDYLDAYAKIFVEGANVYVDGMLILDENNLPVVTDKSGYFNVSVPIGNHAITVKKDGHSLTYNGRYPAALGTYKEFFENSDEPVTFVDTTKITVVGKVVGGPFEAAKKIGFGENGLLTKSTTDSLGNAKIIEVSAKNNIGVANFVLGYKPQGSGVTNSTRATFTTNKTSGEYRKLLLPLQYELLPADLTIPSSGISILDPRIAETFDFTKVEAKITPEFKYKTYDKADTIIIKGTPYHYEKSFVYRSTPTLQVTKQSSDESIKVAGVEMPTINFVNPVYTQFHTYEIQLKRFERYTNKDSSTKHVTIEVPVSDGELIETNNLALLGSSALVTDAVDPSILKYSFKAGVPKIEHPFISTISLKYRIGNIDYDVEGLKTNGIILGGASDGSQTFVTAAPDIPAIILRDPPGSNSYASIEKGTSISVNSQASFAHSEGVNADRTIKLGFSFKLAGGIVPTPVTESSVITTSVQGIGLNNTTTDGNSSTSTYSFNKTISTSSQTDYVGADGDLYIGNSKNIYYGTFDNIEVSNTIPQTYSNGVATPLSEDKYVNLGTVENPIYLSKQKALSFVDKPSETFFVYSQKHILNTLIPEYELFISTNLNAPESTSLANINKRKQYAEKIRLWKKVILNNEKSKYLAKNERARYKETIGNIITQNIEQLKTAYSGAIDPTAQSRLTNQLNQSNSIKNLLGSEFEKNISFDAGVGEYTQTMETNLVKATSTNFNLVLDQSVSAALSMEVNSIGGEISAGAYFQQDFNSSLSQEKSETSKISYSIVDNDSGNFLSIDAVNAFDGNGPIFSTQGGRTSCPYEGAEKSQFYPEAIFKSYFTNIWDKEDQLKIKISQLNSNEAAFLELKKNLASSSLLNANRIARVTLMASKLAIERDIKIIDSVFESGFNAFISAEKAPLNFATQKVEVPVLQVTNNNVTNVPENKNAEFELKLTNNSAAGADADFKLIVDNTTNPNNAITNIEPNGTIVHVPYGQTIIYKMTLGKSISDVYEYNNIKIRLESLCDGEDVSSSVLVSAKFIPSCTEVIVSTPLSNWVFNKDAAFNVDGTSKTMLVNVSGYNSNFTSFKKIDLEYRLASAPNWTRLHTFYNTQDFLNTSLDTSKSTLIAARSTLPYSIDIVDMNLLDGNYEIRARSTCTNNTEFISLVNSGKIDINAPVKFGTPLPIDGILGVGEDIKVSFNEPVFLNSSVSIVEVNGQTNQEKINHNVSLFFEGVNNSTIIQNPKIATGDLTIEFWMKNSSVEDAIVLQQKEGIKIELVNGEIVFGIAGIKVKGAAPIDGLFHHYTFTYKNSTGETWVFVDDKSLEKKVGPFNFPIANNEAIIIGGNKFIGNIHDLRLWNKTIELPDAYAKMYTRMSGNEANLVGYWPMNEGRGLLANDFARYKHAEVKSAWDIKPKGTSYNFANDQYLKLDQVQYIQLTNEMDATVSFWMKTASLKEATIFSNGKGDGSDIDQYNGIDNKWALSINASGGLTFNSEGKQYVLTTQNLADDTWHHISLLFNRQGTLKTYVDAAVVSSNLMTSIGGLSGNRIWIGARGAQDAASIESVDNVFTGKIDEFQLWNTLRTEEQVSRDRYFEVDEQSVGLLLYARMNQPDPINDYGPSYSHLASDNAVITSKAILNTGVVTYSLDAPPIKPERKLINFKVNKVISNNEMILEPDVTDFASLEGQMVDISVHKMFDAANNMQASPITWTAYYKRNEVSWFADGYNELVELVKHTGTESTFEITILNKGGKTHPYTISNIPKWLSLSKTSGNISPDSKVTIIATVDKDYTPGEYIENLNLQTDFAYDEKLQVKLRVLANEPNWTVNPALFDKSMTILGRIKVDGVFSGDAYDQIAAFKNDSVVGAAKLVYNESYKQHYVYLTIYSNLASSETLRFKIWDASQGKILEATLGESLTVDFKDNEIMGTLGTPIILENTTLVEQNIALNKGWTWISMNVNDPNFKNFNELTKKLILETDDRFISGADQEVYSKNILPASWSGSISNSGGLNTNKMYKVYMSNAQTLKLKGSMVNISTWTYPININWNWVPFPLPGNRLTTESLAYLDATEGDLIKSQTQFAIYDPIIGWSGTLKYLEAGRGYMLKSAKSQTFSFPNYLAKTMSEGAPSNIDWTNTNSSNGQIKTNATSNIIAATVIEEGSYSPQGINNSLIADYNSYSQNMNAVVLLPNGFNELLVYDQHDVLKGKATRENGSEIVYITIYGDSPQQLAFFISDGFTKTRTTASFIFKTNEVLGNVANPVILSLNKESTIKAYPNPFSNELTIEMNSDFNQKVTINLYSITSQLEFIKIVDIVKGFNKVKISPNISDGVYLLKVQMNDKVLVNTVIKNALSK